MDELKNKDVKSEAIVEAFSVGEQWLAGAHPLTTKGKAITPNLQTFFERTLLKYGKINPPSWYVEGGARAYQAEVKIIQESNESLMEMMKAKKKERELLEEIAGRKRRKEIDARYKQST
nr:hypothetical protein [Pseudodesulfovibrio sp.]